MIDLTDDTVQAAMTYATLRAAVVAVDKLSTEALHALAERCTEAADKYPSGHSPAIDAANAVLVTFAAYCMTVAWENDMVRRA